jgi:hypothetical protein
MVVASKYLVRYADEKVDLLQILTVHNLNINFRQEVSFMLWVNQEGLKLALESFDIVERSLSMDCDLNLLPHGPATRDVLAPVIVVFNIWNLNHAIVVNTLKGSVKERYVLDEKVDIVN